MELSVGTSSQGSVAHGRTTSDGFCSQSDGAKLGFDQIIEEQTEKDDPEKESSDSVSPDQIDGSWGWLLSFGVQGPDMGETSPNLDMVVDSVRIRISERNLTGLEVKGAAQAMVLGDKSSQDLLNQTLAKNGHLSEQQVDVQVQDNVAFGPNADDENLSGDAPKRAINAGLVLGEAKGTGIGSAGGQFELPTGSFEQDADSAWTFEDGPTTSGRVETAKQSHEHTAAFAQADLIAVDPLGAHDVGLSNGRGLGKESLGVVIQLTSNEGVLGATPQGSSAASSQSTNSTQVINFISNAAQTLKDQPIELVLKPEELGRVRLHLNASESAMGVIIAVERPETLDLLRRNIDQLADQLSDIGYDSLSFEFVEDDRQSDTFLSDGEDQNTEMAETDHSVAVVQVQPIRSMPDEGVDIRM